MHECTRCKQQKPATAFVKDSRRRSGLSSHCRQCRAASRRGWGERNKERLSASSAAYRAADIESARARSREWNRQNRGRVRETMQTWRAGNHDRLSEYRRAYRAGHADQTKSAMQEWHARNPTKRREYEARRRAIMRSAAIGPADYSAVIERSGGVCGICSTPVGDWSAIHFDHIVPLSRGGAHSADNLQVAHAACNMRKHNKWQEA